MKNEFQGKNSAHVGSVDVERVQQLLSTDNESSSTFPLHLTLLTDPLDFTLLYDPKMKIEFLCNLIFFPLSCLFTYYLMKCTNVYS